MKELIRRGYNFCEGVLTYLGIGSALAIMFLTTADALGRYLFNSPVLVAYELIEKYLMPMTLCLGLSFSYRRGTLIRVTLVVERLKKKVKLPINYFVLVISILYAAVLVIFTTERTFETMEDGITLTNIKFPLWPAYLIIPVGLFFLMWVMLFDLPLVKRGRSYLFEEDKEEEIPLA